MNVWLYGIMPVTMMTLLYCLWLNENYFLDLLINGKLLSVPIVDQAVILLISHRTILCRKPVTKIVCWNHHLIQHLNDILACGSESKTHPWWFRPSARLAENKLGDFEKIEKSFTSLTRRKVLHYVVRLLGAVWGIEKVTREVVNQNMIAIKKNNQNMIRQLIMHGK